MIECVVNVSEGRDMTVLRALADACGDALCDVHSDADHNRTVFTLAQAGTRDAQVAARALAVAVAHNVSLVGHHGVHPLLGALDVVPFVPLGGTPGSQEIAVRAAQSFGRWWSAAYRVPVFLFGDADPRRRSLPHARRTAFSSRMPDFGPVEPHEHLGATAVGVRPPLVAVNCLLLTREVDVARRIARSVREETGGLPGVRALGFLLESVQRAQVSMNLIDLDRTGVEHACRRVRVLARQEKTDVAAVELVGLIPRRELDRCSDEFLAWSGLDAGAAIENRAGRPPRWLPGDQVA
ncbi:MAG: glutamate formiminotransferase [Actinomycetia bacterium]|nr:glutamate formiminotransferase [Actinomycetes bacterium]